MTIDDVIRMAEEAGMRKTFVCKNPNDCPDDDDCCHKQVPEGLHGRPEVIERFANLVAAAEREACAMVAEERLLDKANCTAEQMYELQKKSIVAAIRARGR